jgi:predicted translin family RNA/ssDNA-binding protein
MTAEEALTEVGKVNERLLELERKLLHATSDPGSEAVPQLQQEIAEAMARKEWLLGQIQRMEKAG